MNETSDSDDIYEVPRTNPFQRSFSNSNGKNLKQSRLATTSSNVEPRFLNTNQFKSSRTQSNSFLRQPQQNRFKNNSKNNRKKNLSDDRSDFSHSSKKSDAFNTSQSNLMAHFEDNLGQELPPISVQQYRCSDNTLTTGWQPNVDLDVNRLSREIQMANRASLGNSRSIYEFQSSNKERRTQNFDEQIYDILSTGLNGQYQAKSSKVFALEQLCSKKNHFRHQNKLFN